MTFEERADFLFHSIESHDRQIGELTDGIRGLKDAVEKLVVASNRDASSIHALARIAESHERRISDMEGGR